MARKLKAKRPQAKKPVKIVLGKVAGRQKDVVLNDVGTTVQVIDFPHAKQRRERRFGKRGRTVVALNSRREIVAV